MFQQVPRDPSLVQGEHEVLALWERTRAFEKLRKANEDGPRWSFLDGPITANNPMGVHHAWGRTYKDLFQRFFAMTGHHQRYQNGFDCQGLWVEVEVERELGFQSKRDIEEYGLEEFIEECKRRVLKFAEIQTQQSVRLGMWMDWENSYFTMSDENNYTIWSFLKKCHQRGFIYKDLDSMPWCPRCGTGISEQEKKEGYKRVSDEAVFVRLPLVGREKEWLLVWTTTPWTLAANVAAAVHPDLEYAKVELDGDIYYVAKSLTGVLSGKGNVEERGTVRGSEMLGWRYLGPFDDLAAALPAIDAHSVIPWSEVSDHEGTGIVHIAPGCGKEDFDLGKEHGLPVIAPIDESGIYAAGFGFLTGTFASTATPEIYESLTEKGYFFWAETYEHDYPHCWRCDTPLLFRAVDEWYIDMSWRDEIRDVVKQIRWIPEWGEAQELDWLRNMGDWMISKKRYWGLALPIFECEQCGWFDVVGGKEELQERAALGWEQFEGHSPHRPWIDSVRIRCEKCGGTAQRIPDVGNPWLDAGIVTYSTTGYNDDRAEWEKWVPADFVTESFPGQFRNWFYALLSMSTMMENIPPFRTLFGYQLVRDDTGREMHKSWGNMIEFNEAADRVGADLMRWLYCRASPTNQLYFGYKALEEIYQQSIRPLWNVYAFFVNYAIIDGFDPNSEPVPLSDLPEMDRWILSRLQEVIGSSRRNLADYNPAPVMRDIETFIDDLSNWYLRRNRRRFWTKETAREGSDKLAAYQTLHRVLLDLARVLAPMIPFLTERIYQNLAVGPGLKGATESVHLSGYPAVDEAALDSSLNSDMQIVRQVTSAARALREEAGLRVRLPLSEMRLATGEVAQSDALERLSPLLSEELNVKGLKVVRSLGDLTESSARPNFRSIGPKFGASAQGVGDAIRAMESAQADALARGEPVTLTVNGSDVALHPEDVEIHVQTRSGWAVGEAGSIQIALDTTLTPALQLEGLARDVVRQIQEIRKELDLNMDDRISVGYHSEDNDLNEAISSWREYIAEETLAVELQESSGEALPHEVSIAGKTLSLEVKRTSR